MLHSHGTHVGCTLHTCSLSVAILTRALTVCVDFVSHPPTLHHMTKSDRLSTRITFQHLWQLVLSNSLRTGALTFPVLHSCLGQVGREELDPYKTEDMQGIRPLPKSDSEQLDLSIYLFMHSLFCMFQFTSLRGFGGLTLRLVTSGFLCGRLPVRLDVFTRKLVAGVH